MMADDALTPEAASQPKDDLLTPQEGEDTALEAAQTDDGEAQAEAPQGQDDVSAAEVPLGRMRLNDFLDKAGVSMEEFYRDVFVEKDGREVSISAAWDEHQKLQSSLDALSRERDELRSNLTQASTQVPQQQIHPEAQQLLSQAQLYENLLADPNNFSNMEPGQAADQKFNMQAEAQRLKAAAQAKQNEHLVEVRKRRQQAGEESSRELRRRYPQWNDRKVWENDRQAIVDFAGRWGWKPEEVQSTLDPRMWSMLNDMRLSMAKTQSIQDGAKKIRKVTKTLPAGARAVGTQKVDNAALRQQMANATTFEERSAIRRKMNIGSQR